MMEYRLETYGPSGNDSPPDYHNLKTVAVRLLVDYYEWFGFRRHIASDAVNNGDFDTYHEFMEVDNSGRDLINIQTAMYPPELARNIIQFEAKNQGLSVREYYNRLRRANWLYYSGEYTGDKNDLEHDILLMQCLFNRG
jgi:hypothetical protein